MGERAAEKDHTRVTTIRLPKERFEDVVLCARVEGISVSEFIRRAIGNRVVELHQSRTFRASLAGLVARDQARIAALGPLPDDGCCCDRTAARLVVCPVHPDRTLRPEGQR